MNRASVSATWSNVLWSSLRTTTLHGPPSPLPGPPRRGSSTVCDIGAQHSDACARSIDRLALAALSPVACQPRVELLEGCSLPVGGGELAARIALDLRLHLGDERLQVLGAHALGPVVEPGADLGELLLDVLAGAEMGHRQTLRLPRRDHVPRF